MAAPANPDVGAQDLVPLVERMRYLLGFRLMAALTVVVVVLSQRHAGADVRQVLILVAGYVALVSLGQVTWRLLGQRGLYLLGGLLLLDGLFIASAAHLTGGVASPLRHLAIVHLAMVAMLASDRTGLKLALWHSVLLFVGYQLEKDGFLDGTSSIAGVDPDRLTLHLAGYVGAFWMITLVTATFSSVNERELRRRRYDLEALASLASALESAHDPQEVGDQLVRASADAFAAPRALLVVDRPDGSQRMLASEGEVVVNNTDAFLNETSVISRCHAARASLLVAGLDPSADPQLAAMLPGAGNLIVVPMTVEGRAVGTLVVEHDLRPGSRVEQRVVDMLERFASQTALALRGAWLMERVQEQASRDGLTGIANRRTFDQALEFEVQRVRRTGEVFSLVLLDLDHFKILNDTHGHQAGDQVLRDVAEVLARYSRDIDTVARYGGEEFAVILPACPESGALHSAQRLLLEINSADIAVSVTASAGVATWTPDLDGAEQLISAADTALYASKRAGRDRVTAWADLADRRTPP
ncbi:MAG TPA: sensor domain-containing diguanylate cyclase [Mycobacteriales bacterium]|nr:sensor domain-containing diguanylate cyclase [Mycobacteriales bacterium]